MRRLLKPRTLSARLALTYAALLGGSLLFFGLVVYLVFQSVLHRQLDNRLEREAIGFSTSIIIHPDDSLDFSSPILADHVGILRRVALHSVQVIARNGRMLFQTLDTVTTTIRPPAGIPSVKSRVWTEDEELRDGNLRRILYYPVYKDGRLLAWVQISAMQNLLRDAVVTLRNVMIAVSVILLLVTGIVRYYLAKRALQPLTEIAATAEAITSRTLSSRIEGSRYPDAEIRSIATALDNLLERLEQSFQNIYRFTSDAAHELLTPLTVIRQDIEVTLRKRRTSDDYRETLERLGGDTERLTRIVRSLLALSRVDITGFEPTGVCDVASVVGEEAGVARQRAETRGITLHCTGCTTPLRIAASEIRVHTVVANLVENALRYTPAGGTIDITVQITGETAALRVRDSGIGIPPGDEERIFNRFYRAPNALNAHADGAGLGLAIARSFVHADGGTITARNNPAGGAEFEVVYHVVAR